MNKIILNGNAKTGAGQTVPLGTEFDNVLSFNLNLINKVLTIIQDNKITDLDISDFNEFDQFTLTLSGDNWTFTLGN